MNKFGLLAGGVFVALSASALSFAAEAPPVPVIEDAQWKTGKSQDTCSMYNNAEDQFVFVWLSAKGDLGIRVHNKSWSWPDGEQLDIIFGESGNAATLEGQTSRTTDGRSGFTVTMPVDAIAAVMSDENLQLKLAAQAREELTVRHMDAILAWLAQCRGTLREYDPASAIVTPPTILQSPTADEFAHVNHWSGQLAFRLTIDPKGEVSHCDLETTTSRPEVDEELCKILSRSFRFEPALNAAGQAVEGSFRSRLIVG